MIADTSNTLFELAFQFVNETNCPVFLTGKAGTGKTTFLQYVKVHCMKNMMVIAPTGVAAINAGGVTMHSFFQLPFGTFIADAQKGFGLNEHIADKHALLSKIRFNRQKKEIIEELELLIIDEVSMLRCDMLDAIDTILQFVRKNTAPFGGVQMLFIGDLHQLPPVVKDSEKALLDGVYQSPFFFHAKVLERSQPLFIELKKIYRQKEQGFIDLLNNIRNNTLVAHDFQLLDDRYLPDFTDSSNQYITLCSHNYKADAINQHELERLKAPLYEFEGEIKNDYNENNLPTAMVLKLKVGCQVMFIKNDSSLEKRYYNGKIATITRIDDEGLVVNFSNQDEPFMVEQETWDNITYTLDSDTNQIKEKVIGQFIQYPLRLAWAITIHKSQGLTFDHAIIDAGDSFAAGQVYVALSRCTSIGGMVLRTPITQRSLHKDTRIFDFNGRELNEDELKKQLANERVVYDAQRLLQSFSWKKMRTSVQDLRTLMVASAVTNKDTEAMDFVLQIQESMTQQYEMVRKYVKLADSLLNEISFNGDNTTLKIRTAKAIQYFTKNIMDDFIKPLHQFLAKLVTNSKAKKLIKNLQEIEQLWWSKLRELEQIRLSGELILPTELHLIRAQISIPKTKIEKGTSSKESLAYYMSGKSIEEIAQIRNLAISTIEGHLAEFVRSGELGIETFLNDEQLQEIKKAYHEATYYSTTEIKTILQDAYSHGQIRMAVNYLFFKNEIDAKPSRERVVIK